MLIRKSTHQFRVQELNLFKWTKQGILMTYKQRKINLDEYILKDKDGTLDWLNSLLDQVEFNQQRLDIKEVIEYYIEL